MIRGVCRIKFSIAAVVVPAVAGLAFTGCGGGSHTPPAAENSVAKTAPGSQETHDQVVDLGWSEGFYLPGATEWLSDHVCPPETPYLINHDYAPFGTQVVKGVEIQQNSDPWAINVYAPMYASRPVDPDTARPWASPGYLIGLHSWNIESDAAVIVNSVTHWGLASAFSEGHKYKLLLHCTDDTSRARIGKYIPLNALSATRPQITRTLAAEGVHTMTLAQLKAERPSKH